MTVHVHGCLSCRPGMVPDFTRDDSRYHDGTKCGYTPYALIDGIDPGYTAGIFEGADGWALVAGKTTDDIDTHVCVDGHINACLTPVFGRVEVRHHCPEGTVAQLERAKDILRTILPDRWCDLIHGRESR